ncbi:MAG: EAL domain-containing protein [Lachnospira eligens]
MVSFIIKMYEMGLHVCIEGVETKEELSCVKKLGADYIQGYYYGKPVCLQILKNST